MYDVLRDFAGDISFSLDNEVFCHKVSKVVAYLWPEVHLWCSSELFVLFAEYQLFMNNGIHN